MKTSDYTNIIKELILDVRPDITLNTNVQLLDDGLLDSVDVIEIVVLLEKRFNIDIKQEDIEPIHFENLNSLSSLLENYLNSEE